LIYELDINFNWNPLTFKALGIIFSLNMSDIPDLNYSTRLPLIKKIINTWSRRTLTPFGKITVIKTLIVSKLVYLFSNLPDPSDDFMLELEKILFNFLWNGKNDRINRKTVCQDYDAGGLKMLDIKSFLLSLKLSWLKRILLNEGKVSNIVIATCPSVKDILIRGNKFVEILANECYNPFWCDVFKHYKMFYQICSPNDFNDFISEPLHFNAKIVRDGKYIYIQNWIDNGILKIGNFFNENGLLSYNDFLTKFPGIRINFLLYEGIIMSIKKYQRKLGFQDQNIFNLSESKALKMLLSDNKKEVYSYCVKRNIHHKCIDKWNNCFGIQIRERDVFRKIIKTTQDTTLRWFQFRLIYRIIPTNRFLLQRKIVNSSICTFCSNEEESLIHLFWNCHISRNFWNEFEIWIKTTFDHCNDFFLTKELIIFGRCTGIYLDTTLDLFILIAKYSIYAAKIKQSKPNLNTLIWMLKQRFEIEKYNSYTTCTQVKFNNNWRLYNDFFESSEN